jgi:hypothetical protein
MFALVLQVGGFLATYLFVILYFALGGRGGHELWAALIAFALTVHFAGDYARGFLKKNDPVVFAGYNLGEMLNPPYFLLWVGLALDINALFFLASHHQGWGCALGGIGTSLAGTGFLWSLIYNPASRIDG